MHVRLPGSRIFNQNEVLGICRERVGGGEEVGKVLLIGSRQVCRANDTETMHLGDDWGKVASKAATQTLECN